MSKKRTYGILVGVFYDKEGHPIVIKFLNNEEEKSVEIYKEIFDCVTEVSIPTR